MRCNLIIRLGTHGSHFCHTPPEGLTLLGTVQEAAALGALARRADGRYVQLNGDFERLLNTSRVEKAMRRGRGQPYVQPTSSSAPAAAPVVVVKRRRVLLPQD